MKRKVLFGFVSLLAGSLLAADTASPAADSSPKNEVTAAAKALAAKDNYSWTTTVTVPEGNRFRPGPTDGKIEKGGLTEVKMSFGGDTTEIVLQGGKTVVNSPDGGWQSLSELENEEGPGRFIAMMARSFTAPAEQAEEYVADAKELKKEGDVYSSDLTEKGAKALLSFRRRGGDGNGPDVSDAKGTIKFWVKDGVLAKYQTQVSGKISFNGNDRDVDRTTTVEIKDVNSTKVEVPDEARKKLNPAPAPAEKKM